MTSRSVRLYPLLASPLRRRGRRVRHGRRRRLASLVLVISFILPSAAIAQLQVGADGLSQCSKIDALRKKGKTTDARDAARRCLESLEKDLEGQVGTFFLEEIAGWKRMHFEQNNALGMRTINARYGKDGVVINVSLLGGTGGGGGLMGALGGMAQLGLMGGGAQPDVSVAGLKTTILPDGKMMVQLSDKSYLNFDSPAYPTPEEVLEGIGEFINAFPVGDIDETLSGK